MSEPSDTTIRTNQIVNIYNITSYSPMFLNLTVNIELKEYLKHNFMRIVPNFAPFGLYNPNILCFFIAAF
jgi:hypothetical protein